MNEEQLRWIHYNQGDAEPPSRERGGRPRTTRWRDASRAGEVLPQVLRSVCSNSALQQRIRAVLAEHGADELLQWARIKGVRLGELELEIDEPGRRYHLRVNWEQRVLELMQNCLPDLGIHSIRFGIAPGT